jgi:predicted chitinase
LVNHPELLEDPAHGIRASACWWKMNGLNHHVDQHPFDILGASVIVNGVNKKTKLPNHLQERQRRFISISKFLGVRPADQHPGSW